MDQIVFQTEITSTTSLKTTPVYYPVSCAYERPENWAPPLYDPLLFQTHGQGDLAFHMALMKDDFSGVATSTTFSLGSMIPIAASVDQQSHQPLMLLLEECVASTTPEIGPDSHIYPLITNKGCLVDSKKTSSVFLPRSQLSEIRLNLQAFKFAIGEDVSSLNLVVFCVGVAFYLILCHPKVYIHCKLVAWDPRDLDGGKKACQYDKSSSRYNHRSLNIFLPFVTIMNGPVSFCRWLLLDDPSQSSLCSCCDTKCRGRKKRGITADSLMLNSVLGPLVIIGN
ncbi:zona pellucida sperm-binding protein 3-like isoform X5 [Myxocyprinus asiaticus]|uniref:zona pellucida sperm-binding protein 3-like isoform X5 n=1 Tax=Myxocyprinus asiaticus TaxID=70543 RepID=UPI00222188D5|nr:zona pellucida sperm-binding protein 3-like isoform X5 [Myxocyprinus asiaticus]